MSIVRSTDARCIGTISRDGVDEFRGMFPLLLRSESLCTVENATAFSCCSCCTKARKSANSCASGWWHCFPVGLLDELEELVEQLEDLEPSLHPEPSRRTSA